MSLSRSLVFGQLLWALFVIVCWISLVMGHVIDPDYTAGELLDHYWTWVEGQALYPALDQLPYRVLNYPPLFFVAVRALAIDPLHAHLVGRLIGIASFLGVVTLLYLWLRRVDVTRIGAVLTVSLVAISSPLLYPLGQFHFELLAVFLSFAGFYLLMRSAGTVTLILAAVLLASACFVKQTQVPLSLIGLLWLFCYRRRDAVLCTLTWLVVGSLGALLLQINFGPEIWRHLIHYTIGTYSLQQLAMQGLTYMAPWSVLLVLGLWRGTQDADGRRTLSWWLFVGSSIWLFSAARNGSSYQYFILWQLATLLWVGPSLDRCLHGALKLGRLPATLVSALLIVQIVLADVGVAAGLYLTTRDSRALSKQLPALCRALPSQGAWVAAEQVILPRLCGARATHHPFIMASLARQGLWDEGPLVQALAQAKIPAVLLPFDPAEPPPGVHAERWTPAQLAAIQAAYRRSQQIGVWYVLYLKSITPPNLPL